MEDDQQFCLRWNNHQSTLIQNFDTLLESGTLVDCTLAAEGKYLKAHKVVLSACSPYFEGLLSEHYDKHPVFILKDVKFKELKAMMDYMYRGEVNISQDQLTALLKAAESLQIKGLSDSRTGGGAAGGSATSSSKTETRSAKAASSTAATSSSLDIPHASSGLTIEKNSKVPRQSLQQVSVSDLPEDSASPQLRGLSSREGSQSPTSRKRLRKRKRSVNNDDTNSMENHEASNSSDVNISAPALGVAPVATEEKSHADPAETIGRSALMQQLTKPADEMLQIPIEKPEPSEEMIQPKSEYLDDQDDVEDLTNLDDDMNDLNEMEQDNSRAGPSHDPSQHGGIASWHISGDRSNASVVGAAAGPPGQQDEVFLAAHEAAQAQRDSQAKIAVKRFVTPHSSNQFKQEEEEEIAEIIIDDGSSTVREVHYFKEDVYLDASDDQDEAFDTLALDSNFELTYCASCQVRNKLITWTKDLRCEVCQSNLEYVCERCDKMYKRIKSLRYHLRHDCNKDPAFNCDYCDYKTTRKASLQLHMKCKHSKVQAQHACPKCGKVYKHRFHMLGHSKYCGKTETEICQFCDYKTYKPSLLKMHIRNLHTDLDKIDYYHCSICRKSYKHSKSYYKHKLTCPNAVIIECAHCDYNADNKLKLLTHIKREHKDIYPSVQQESPNDRRKRKLTLPKRYIE